MGFVDALLLRGSKGSSPLVLIYAFCLATIIYNWCKVDAASRNVKPPAGISILAAFLLPVGMPVYFFCTRPPGRALVSIFKGGILFAMLTLAYAAGSGVVLKVLE